MEENRVPVLAKKVWRLVRVMLRKNRSKTRLLIDLSRMIKRGKITAAKTLHNLISHHHHHHHHNWASNFATNLSPPPLGEYEEVLSCTTSPINNHPIIFSSPFTVLSHNYKHHSSCNQLDTTTDIMAVNAAAMEMIHTEMASPALPGFGRSPPVVRQLRVTDSPFSLSNQEEDDDRHHVDEAAEQFISRFYNDLKRQNSSCTRG